MPLVDLVLVNAKIVTAHGIIEGGIAVDNGKICAVGKEGHLPPASTRVNVKDQFVLPGLVDVHVHLRDLALNYKEDFYTGTCAALAGGFTTVLDMPNTRPPTDSVIRLQEKMELARRKCVTNLGFYACLPQHEEEIDEIQKLGTIGFKIYFHHPLTKINIKDDVVLSQVFHRLKELDLIVAVHAEDRQLIKDLQEKLQGEVKGSLLHKIQTHPSQAEVKAVTRILTLMGNSNPRLHFCHISTPKALTLISEAKRRGLRVTSEVTPHHLLLPQSTVQRSGGFALVDPPLRTPRTCKRLRQALLKRQIDIVASDHAPHTRTEKLDSNVWKIPGGFPGLETTLPLLLTLMKNSHLSLEQLVTVLAQNPARIFRLSGKGVITEGYDADLTVIDLKTEFKIDSSTFYSKAKYSPFDGMNVIGKPLQVFLGGQLVMDHGEIISKPGDGNIIQ